MVFNKAAGKASHDSHCTLYCKKIYFFVLIAAIAALSGILFGYDTEVISGATLFINDEFHLSPQLNSIFIVAGLLGADILHNKTDLIQTVDDAVKNNLNPPPISSEQEMLESILNNVI